MSIQERRHDPEFVARMRAGHEAHFALTGERLATVRRLADEGWSVSRIARAIKADEKALRRRATDAGVVFAFDTRHERGDAVLREHWPSNMHGADVFRLYLAALKVKVGVHAMRQRAVLLGIKRPERNDTRLREEARQDAWVRGIQQHVDNGLRLATASRLVGIHPKTGAKLHREGLVRLPDYAALARAKVSAARAASAERVRAVIGGCRTLNEAAAAAGVSRAAIWSMRKAELVTLPPQMVHEGPNAVPVVRQRAPAPPPPPPKPPAQTVEEWLAAGGQIKRCPAVALIPTQAEISAEDRAAMQAHYVANPEPLTWKQQRLASYRSAKGKGLVT